MFKRPDPVFHSLLLLVLAAIPHQGQEKEEELDDVDVQTDGCHGVVIYIELVFPVTAPGDELRVINQVNREQQSPESGIDFLGYIVSEKNQHEPKHEEDYRCHHQVGAPAGEVIFGLEREQSEC